MKNKQTSSHNPHTSNISMNYNVLVVDDSSFMRTLLSKIFENTDSIRNIYQAINGDDSLKMYKEKKPDLVTMDIDMPGMNGLIAAEKIKSFDPAARIVMVTSSDKSHTREDAKKIGVCGYITKPFDRKHIQELIENISK